MNKHLKRLYLFLTIFVVGMALITVVLVKRHIAASNVPVLIPPGGGVGAAPPTVVPPPMAVFRGLLIPA
jgi:hypothetical protein